MAFREAKFTPPTFKELEGEFYASLSDLDLSSTPGFGYHGTAYGGNNRNCLCNEDGTWNPDRVEVLKNMVLDRMYALGERPYADPIRVFVKQEALKRAKRDEKRWRIISAVSLEDTLIDRILFRRFQRSFIDSAGKTPSMVGLNPCCGGFRQFMTFFGAGPYVCEDKSAWDWTVTEPLLRLALELILQLAVDPEPWWEAAVRARWALLYRDAVYAFELHGERIQQPYIGVVKSGCYLTIVLNTMLQYVLHAAVNVSMGLPPHVGRPFCFGDDTLRKVHPEEVEYLRRVALLGISVKTELRDKPEFAGFEFDAHHILPVYRAKHAFKVMHCPDDVLSDVLETYQVLYAEDSAVMNWLHKVCVSTDNRHAAVSQHVAQLVSRGVLPYREIFGAEALGLDD